MPTRRGTGRRGIGQSTVQRQTKAILWQDQVRLATIIDSAMDAIITVDADQHITLFNAAAEQLFGCSRTQALGQSFDVFIPERYRTAHGHHIAAFGRTGATSRSMGAPLQPLIARRADGSEFPIEATISQAEVGGQKLYTVIIRDITERTRREEQQQFLVEATNRLSSSLDYAARASLLTQLVIPYLADYSLLFRVEPNGMHRPVTVHTATWRRNPSSMNWARAIRSIRPIPPASSDEF
jgi:PAS domain S-box-containing protein